MYRILFLLLVLQVIVHGQYNDDMNRFMLAQNYEQNGDIVKAKTIYEDLYKRHPDNPQFFEALNRSYIGLKDYDGSASIIQNRLKQTPDDVNLYGMLGSTYYLKGDEDKAYTAWDKGLKRNPSNSFSYKIIANYAIERRSFEKAIEYLQRGKELNQNPLIFAYDLANLYTITMQYSNAAKEYIVLLEKDPNQLSMIQQRILTSSSKPEALKSYIEAFENAGKNVRKLSDRILAQLYIQSKDYKKGFELYKEIDKEQGAAGAELFNYAQNLVQQGEYKTSSEIFNYLLEEYPSSPVIPSVKLSYAKNLEDELESHYSEISWKSYYIKPAADSKDAQKIISAYNDIIKSFPNTEQAFEAAYRKGVIYKEYLKNDKEAEQILSNLIKDAPVSFYSIYAQEKLADIYFDQGNLDKSKELYSNIVNSNRLVDKELNIARFRLGKLYFYTGDFENAKNQLNSLITDFKDDYSNDAIGLSLILNTMSSDSSNLIKYAQAEQFTEQGKFSEARDIYKQLSADQGLFIMAGLAKFRSGEMDIALDNYDSAIKTLSEIGAEKEKNIYSDKALYLLGKIYRYAKKDNAATISVYEKLLAEFPQSIYLDEVREEINLLKKVS